MSWLEPVTLRGRTATLQPLTHDYHDELVDSVRDGELWRLWYTTVPDPQGMSAEIQRRLDRQSSGMMLPFVVLDHHGNAVGMTTLMNIDAVNRRMEIGSTWYRKRVQQSGLNTECKFMLMRHVFEVLDCIAVELRTSSFNRPSRRAIERIGAKVDGVLRNHQRHRDGTLRDTYVYSVINAEWPSVKRHLTFLLNR